MDVEHITRLISEYAHDPRLTRHGLRLATLDVSGNCRRPVPVTKWSRQWGECRHWKKGAKNPPVAEITLLTRCRKCPTCLKMHANIWANRAAAETAVAARTWFGTLTLSPQAHYVVDTLCATREREFWNLSQDKQFGAQCKVIGAEITKWLKRIRKESGHQFRYLLVIERHDSERTSDEMRGRAHAHLLLHEMPGQKMTKRLLEKQWHLGNSHWRLVNSDRHAAFYVTKYVSKAIEARTRASIDYGNPLGMHELESALARK